MELKIGGKITLTDNKKYIIIDFVETKSKKYLFCVLVTKKVEAKFLEYKIVDDEYKIREEDDPEIIYELSHKILAEKDEDLLNKIEKTVKK